MDYCHRTSYNDTLQRRAPNRSTGGAVATLFLWRHPCGLVSKGTERAMGPVSGPIQLTNWGGQHLGQRRFWAGLCPLQSCQCNRDRIVGGYLADQVQSVDDLEGVH